MAIHRIQLVVTGKEGQRLAQYTLASGEYFIGRGSGCEIQLNEPNVSRRHARLVVSDRQVLLEDLGSTHGTLVKGERVTAPTTLKLPCVVQTGDGRLEIQLADEPMSEFATVNVLQGPKYRVGVTIAQGGMGAVLNAEDVKLGRPVAMKRMLAPAAASPDNLRRFVREAQVLGRLEHPNIVPIHDLGLDERGEVFYTMKFVQGRTLHAVLRSIKQGHHEDIADYPLSHLLTVFQKVCDAVAFAHSKGIIHRDLKPANIMIGEYGEVLVMDWGLAKILYAGEEEPPPSSTRTAAPPQAAPAGELTLPGDILGTPNFMAPEQAAGRVEDQDQRTDIFALGGILYNILTLHTPVRGDTVGELLGKIQRGHIPPPIYYNRRREIEVDGQTNVEEPFLPHCPGGQVPESLSAVAMKALAVHRGERYQTVAELQKEIEAYGGGFATTAEQASAGKQMWLLIKRRKVEFGLSAAALAVITILAAGAFLRINAEKKQAQQALTRLRATGPSLATLAAAQVKDKHFLEAWTNINYALELRPEDAAYHQLKGDICQSLFRFAEASDAYAQALKLNPAKPFAAENLSLCQKLMAEAGGTTNFPATVLEQLRQAMLSQGRTAEAVAISSRINAGEDDVFESWKAKLEKAGVKGALTKDADGRLKFRAVETAIQDLAPFKGMPLSELALQACEGVADLSPLKGMRLRSLGLHGCGKVSDLGPLRGMPLDFLDILATAVDSLEPLKEMPLKVLVIQSTRVTDLSPLKGMALESVDLANTGVGDLSPLQGMPLISITIVGSKVSSLTPLKGMPLTELAVRGTKVQDLTPLFGMSLITLDLASTRVTDISPLRGMPLKRLSIGDVPATNLHLIATLRDLGILNLSGAKPADWDFLKGLSLTELTLSNTQIKDLGVLAGMPLEKLYLNGARITDLAPLRSLPLKMLSLEKCPLPLDLSPLAECARLEYLVISVNANNLDSLRQMPGLKRIGYSLLSVYDWDRVTPAADFWKAYDARRNPVKAK